MNAMDIKVGDRLLIGSAEHWPWRSGVHHWATVEKIYQYTYVGYQIGSYECKCCQFLVKWDNRTFYIFPKRSWIEAGDIRGVRQVDGDVSALEKLWAKS